MLVDQEFISDGLGANDLYLIRSEFGLSLTEAASALGIVGRTLEKYESDTGISLTASEVKNKYHHFVSISGGIDGKNLLFDQLPLRVARELMCCNISEISSKYGYSANTWRKYECNQRELPVEIKIFVEDDMRSQFKKLCE